MIGLFGAAGAIGQSIAAALRARINDPLTIAPRRIIGRSFAALVAVRGSTLLLCTIERALRRKSGSKLLWLPSQCIQMIRPRLHHLRTRFEIQRMVISRARIVPLLMCKLQLDVVMLPALLMQDRRRDAPKAVPSHPSAIAHPVQSK